MTRKKKGEGERGSGFCDYFCSSSKMSSCPKRRPLLQYLTTSIAYHYVRHGVRNRLDQEGKSKYHRCTYGTQKTKRFFFRFVRTVEFSSYLFPYEDEFCRDTKRTNLFQSCRWFLRPSRDTPRTQPERTERT